MDKKRLPEHTQDMSLSTPKPIRVLITGGTFDKDYDELSGTLTFRDTHLPEILRYSRITVPMHLELIELIDSLEMQDRHREGILNACRRAEETRIIVTHGTDTMTETARRLGQAAAEDPELAAKTIVLTGAMLPYTVLHSDAVFNLAFAVAAVQLLSPGVCLCMNGQVFPWNKAQKNTKLGLFEEIEPTAGQS